MLSRETSARRRRAALAHACVACLRPWAVRAVRNADGVYLLVCRYCTWREVRSTDGAAAAIPAPRMPADHTVLFYDTDDELLRRIVALVGDAVAADGTCVVIATPEHRAVLRERLGSRAVLTGQRLGALVELDAEGTLQLFLHDGRPDPTLFDQTVGALVREQAASGRQVRAYGEMVSLLWARGQDQAALELEQLWNGLQERVRFTLLCAYPSEVVAQAGSDDHRRICAEHTALAA